MDEKPTIVILTGISGDLSRRKIIPAIIEVFKKGFLPKNFQIVGTTRQANLSAESVLKGIKGGQILSDNLSILSVDISDEDDLKILSNHLLKIEEKLGTASSRLYYLSVPPEVVGRSVQALGLSGLSSVSDTKLLLEKPFGGDFDQAKDLIATISQYFKPEQIYRIDHYLAKEMVQNMIVFRQKNYLFRKNWNNKFIKRIEINAFESIGIEGRVNFYEQTGALKDLVQSHLLQVLANVLLDTEILEDKDLPALRYRALSLLDVKNRPDGTPEVIRGQYKDYRNEVKNDNSNTETFVRLELESRDPNWEGVPIILSTGKAMDKKSTEVHIYYKNDQEETKLTFKIQPNEGINFDVITKAFSYQEKSEIKNMSLDLYDPEMSINAYERVIVDSVDSNKDIFVTDEQVLECWRVLGPILHYWKSNNNDLIFYETGSDLEKLIP